MPKYLTTIILFSLIVGCSKDSDYEPIESIEEVATTEAVEPVENTEVIEETDTENISESNMYYGNSNQFNTWNGYECTSDCSGHEAGYEWAEDNSVTDESSCDGNSNSFNEGCEQYVSENAATEEEVEEVEDVEVEE